MQHDRLQYDSYIVLAKEITVDEPDSYHAQIHYTNIILDELAAVLPQHLQ